jgi:hydrogenase nickel incorporation protein HypA/HybF
MHELSIAMSIVEMAEEEALRLGTSRIEAVHLEIGALSGVVPRALEAAYALACEQTPLEGSRLVIREVPIVASCAACGREGPVASVQMLTCSNCGTPSISILQGRELQVVGLEIQE